MATLLLLILAATDSAQWHIKQVAFINRGMDWDLANIVPWKISRDSRPTLIFSGGIPGAYDGLYFYRYAPTNRYVLAKIDTGNIGMGLIPGNMAPWAAGDIDHDSCQELVGFNGEGFSSYWYDLATVYKPPSGHPCPDSLVWYARYDSNPHGYGNEPFYITDLDQDGKKEIFFQCAYSGLLIYEYVANDSLRLAATPPGMGYAYAFGDFDRDGGMEYASAGISSPNPVMVGKCIGDDQYVPWDTVIMPYDNGHDVFSAKNLDGTGRQVFFVSFYSVPSRHTWLYMFEPTQGTHGYEPYLVAESDVNSSDKNARSVCGDIDGDGTDEVIWSCGTHILMFKCLGGRDFEQVWYWSNGGNNSCNLNVYDMNGNGYNEILMSGSGRTIIFEIEALRVLFPNSRFAVRGGETLTLQWQTFHPPPCDSISLFLRKDTTWQLDTIAHGLAPTETTYRWVVPNLIADSCRIVAIAYGPGWQYDESDTAFRIEPSGVEEGARIELPGATALLDVSPNPFRARVRVRFSIGAGKPLLPGRNRGSDFQVAIMDVSGRTVATLANGPLTPGYYDLTWDAHAVPPGVYFLCFSGSEHQETRKLLLTR
jgi:hypothetical protein